MHKLISYICDELDELERKADKDGKLSMSEVQYADTLAHLKKNLLKSEELWDESEYSMDDGMRRSNAGMREGSYARGRRMNGRRGGANQYGSYGYSRTGDVIEDLRGIMQDLPDDNMRQEVHRLIQKMERM